MRIRRGIAGMGALAAAVIATGPATTSALGQTNYGALPSDRQKEYVALGKSCKNEAAHYCPGISPLQPRNIAICLKPFSSNLSLQCRASLRSVGAGVGARPADTGAE